MNVRKTMNILWTICLIALLFGVIFMGVSESKEEYSTYEYWVAKDYAHVYEKYSGQIVNKIEEDEYCEIDGDTITVTTRIGWLYGVGAVIVVLFGMFAAGLIWAEIDGSGWWDRLCHGEDYIKKRDIKEDED